MSKPSIGTIRLAEPEGNAFTIMSRTQNALKKAGYTVEHVQEYLTKATSGDYENLKKVTEEYVDVTWL